MDEMREKSGKEQQGEIEKIDLIEFLRSFHMESRKCGGWFWFSH
mgnify:CR=1 FL=1